MKTNNSRELWKLSDVCKQHIRANELSNHYDSDTFLTIAKELYIDEVTRLKWMEYSNDSQTNPRHSELLKFLNLQARHFECVIRAKPWITTHRSYVATIEEACMACGRGGNYSLGTCSKFQGMSCEECWDMVKKGAMCKNCWKAGHITSILHLLCAKGVITPPYSVAHNHNTTIQWLI